VAALLFQRRGGGPICFDFVALFRVLSPKGLSLCLLAGSGASSHHMLVFLVLSGPKVRLTALGRGAVGGSFNRICHTCTPYLGSELKSSLQDSLLLPLRAIGRPIRNNLITSLSEPQILE
jgi:hypothetical protein